MLRLYIQSFRYSSVTLDVKYETGEPFGLGRRHAATLASRRVLEALFVVTMTTARTLYRNKCR